MTEEQASGQPAGQESSGDLSGDDLAALEKLRELAGKDEPTLVDGLEGSSSLGNDPDLLVQERLQPGSSRPFRRLLFATASFRRIPRSEQFRHSQT